MHDHELKIAIIGAGNAGCAHAFKLSQRGHNVRLIKTSHTMHDDNFDEIKKNGGIWAIDNTDDGKKSFQSMNLITRDVQKGLDGADAVLVMTQSLQHEQLSSLIAPCITANTRLLLIVPGNLGSMFFRNSLKQANIIIGEGESTPYDARIIEPGVVNVLFMNVRNALSFLPMRQATEGLSIANRILHTYTHLRTNVIESALHNPNLVVHTVGVIMSAGRIEYSKGEFWMYREAFTDSIWNLVNALDDEKNCVIKAFGGKPSPYIDECKFRNEMDLTIDSLTVFKSYAEHGGPKGPSSINTRYLNEDVPNGLCLLSSLGKLGGINTPVCDSLITIASALLKTDFWKVARTASKVGIDKLDIQETIEMMTG